MRDFSLDIYRELLEAFLAKGYRLISFAEYLRNTGKPGKDKRDRQRKDERIERVKEKGDHRLPSGTDHKIRRIGIGKQRNADRVDPDQSGCDTADLI